MDSGQPGESEERPVSTITQDRHGRPAAETGPASAGNMPDGEDLRIQYELERALGASRSLEESLAASLDAALRVSGLECGGIYLVDGRTGDLSLAVYRNLPPEFAERVSRYPAGSANARLVMAGKPVFSRYSEFGGEIVPAPGEIDLQTVAVVPVKHDGRVVACLNLGSSVMEEVPPRARLPLAAIALQIGAAIFRVKAHEAVVREQNNLRAVFDQVRDLLVVCGTDGRIQAVNARVSQLLGYQPEELLGQIVVALHPPELREEAIRACYAIVAGQQDTVTIPMAAKDGRWVPVETRLTRGLWDGREVFFAVCRETSERARAEAERAVEFDLLNLLNSPRDVPELAHEVIACLHRWSGCEAVGLLLRENGGYFYHEASGSPSQPEFTERRFRGNGTEREIGLGGLGAGVLSGRVDTSLPGRTDSGGFWTNRMSALPRMAGTELRPDHGPAYESLALMPVRAMGESLGWLRFADKRENRFDERLVRTLERLAGSLALALAQRRAVASLRQSEQRWQFALEGAGEGVWDWDVPGNAVYFSPRWKEQLGFQDNDLPCLFEEWHSRVHPDDRGAVEAAIKAHLAGHTPIYTSEYRMACKDGSWRWLLDRGKVMSRDAGGRPLRVVGTHVDISHVKEVEEALRNSEAWLRESQRVSRVASFVGDLTTGTWAASENYFEIFGVSTDAPRTPQTWMNLLHPDHRAEISAFFFDNVCRHGQSFDHEYRIVRPSDGQTRWINERGGVLRDASGRVVKVTGTWQDITERKRMEEHLLQVQKLESVGRLAGGVAHDFNNLLTVINGFSRLLLAEMPHGSPHHQSVQEIHRAGERAAELTRQLLAFSRRQVLQPRILCLNQAVAETEQMLRRLIGEDIRFMTTLDPAAGLVRADPGQLSQVLLNLVVNARDAMPFGGVLTVETANVDVGADEAARHADARAGRFVCLTVTDTGTGMDEETQRHLFEPFYTTKPPGAGTGLGLSTVYGIVQQSGGWISVRSAPQQGATFRIYLPRVESAPRAAPPMQLPAGEAGSETILVVEDQAMVRRLAARVLRAAGYRVLEAGDGAEALRTAAAHSGPIHLVLTDVVMPGMSGCALVAALQAARPGIKVIYMSGYADDTLIQHGVAGGSAVFLPKPWSPNELIERTRAMLAGPEKQTK